MQMPNRPQQAALPDDLNGCHLVSHMIYTLILHVIYFKALVVSISGIW
jgi:hypothetical protein